MYKWYIDTVVLLVVAGLACWIAGNSLIPVLVIGVVIFGLYHAINGFLG